MARWGSVESIENMGVVMTDTRAAIIQTVARQGYIDREELEGILRESPTTGGFHLNVVMWLRRYGQLRG